MPQHLGTDLSSTSIVDATDPKSEFCSTEYSWLS